MKPPDWTVPILRVIGTALTAVASLAIVSYAINEPVLASWPGSIRMSFMAGCCFLLTGLGFLVLSRKTNGG